jgi:hypothetical protein
MAEIDPRTGIVSHPPGMFGSSCEWLLQRLREEGIQVHPDCELARALNVLRERKDAFDSGPWGTMPFFYHHVPIYTADEDTEFVTQMLQASATTLGDVNNPQVRASAGPAKAG